MHRIAHTLLFLSVLQVGCFAKSRTHKTNDGYPCFSGIYPHLAYYNSQGECGTGAVVPWADRLWVVTYSPHMPFGSDDKLYEISPDLTETARSESVGGTPANRAVHPASHQLFIGPYAIDTTGHVRVIPYDRMPGRPTGIAAHLKDPENRLLLATMEEGFYDIDVHTLDVVTLYKDGNQMQKEGAHGELAPLLPGYHGKGFYSGQGVAVYSNNGEEGLLAQRQFDIPSGSLSEWDGKEWHVVRRNQFTEVTGPGGIEGNAHSETDPIWTVGFDYKSIILGVREPQKGWSWYRLPKASFAYDGAHGWNTEWPRIRNVGSDREPEYLMTMHGMFWHFPGTFSSAHTVGIQPRGSYLKVIGDFTRWNDRLVFGCDDSANSEFLNVRSQKGKIVGAGQSHSNLWFTSLDQPDHLGPTTAGGSIWLHEDIQSGIPSEPFLFSGWENRGAWISNEGNSSTTITIETDREGDGRWQELKSIPVAAGTSLFVPFTAQDQGVWIRAVSSADIHGSMMFSYAPDERRNTRPDAIFRGLAQIGGERTSQGLMYALPHNRRAMALLADGTDGEQYYELDGAMNLEAKNDTATVHFMRQHFTIPRHTVEIDSSSILVVDAKGRRWRLPMGSDAYTSPTLNGELRICREVCTERDLMNCHGTFYEVPAENADGFAKIRPISSHRLSIHDYASYRGMMMMTGIDPRKAQGNGHVIASTDGKAAVWAGVIDDLWKLGKPTGHGGPWNHTSVKAGEYSDPYLIGFYDQRSIRLSHTSDEPVTYTLEADPTGDGQWFEYARYTVKPGKTLTRTFPSAFQARWIRVKTDKATSAIAQLEYK